LLGKWNWWAPQPLKRLHERFGLKEHVLPEADPVPEPVPSNAGS
jgi:RND superfamily putative drug exporter